MLKIFAEATYRKKLVEHTEVNFTFGELLFTYLDIFNRKFSLNSREHIFGNGSKYVDILCKKKIGRNRTYDYSLSFSCS